jgi:hypothetical protein
MSAHDFNVLRHVGRCAGARHGLPAAGSRLPPHEDNAIRDIRVRAFESDQEVPSVRQAQIVEDEHAAPVRMGKGRGRHGTESKFQAVF